MNLSSESPFGSRITLGFSHNPRLTSPRMPLRQHRAVHLIKCSLFKTANARSGNIEGTSSVSPMT